MVIGHAPLDALTSDQVVTRVFDDLDAGRGGLLVTPNLDILRRSRGAADAVTIAGADLLVCDGAPLLWAARLAGTPLPERVPGSDLIWSLSAEAARRGRSVFVLGGPPGAAETALARLQLTSPGLEVAGHAAPRWTGTTPPPDVLASLIAQLTSARPDVVFVCLGFPKQEHLALALREHLPGAWFVGCGAAVEFVSGTRRRAPASWQRLGLEWVYRMAQEPRRLAPRYALDAVYATRLLTGAALQGLRRRRS